MSDRAQDTEAIRAARGLNLANAASGIRGCDAVWVYDQDAAYSGMKAWAEAVVAERDRLVARLEAVERERDEARRISLARLSNIEGARAILWQEGDHDGAPLVVLAESRMAALAAAAPGETTSAAEPKPSCAKPTRGIYGVQSRCARPLGHYGDCDSIWNHRDWASAAPGETEQTP